MGRLEKGPRCSGLGLELGAEAVLSVNFLLLRLLIETVPSNAFGAEGGAARPEFQRTLKKEV